MTGSLPGLMLFDLVLTGTGLATLVAIRPAATFVSVLSQFGLCFWIGLAVQGVALTWLATLGPGPSRVAVGGIAGVALGGAIASRVRFRGGREHDRPRPLSLVAAIGFGLVAAICTGELLAAWNRPLSEWDGWAFWIPKARLLFDVGRLRAADFTQFSGTTYPPLVPLVHGAAFGFMGAADEVTLHLQAAVFFAAFIHAVATLSRRVAGDLDVVPFVLLLATIPEVLQRALQLDGDYPTEFSFVLAALLIMIAVHDGSRWPLVAAALLLALSANARREGLIYVGAVFVAALVVIVGRRRSGIGVAAAAIAAGVAAIPWLLWVRVHHVQADSVPPPAGVGSVIHGNSAGSSLGHAIGVLVHYLFRFDLWSAAPYIGIAVLFATALAGRRALPLAGFVGVILLVTGAAMLWRLLWYGGDVNPSGTPIPRISGMWSLLLCAVAPLLCASAVPRPRLPAPLAKVGARLLGRPFAVTVAAVPAALVIIASASSLGTRLAGCEVPPSTSGPVVVVFGRASTYAAAAALRDDVVKVGFVGTRVGFDQCGRLRVQLGAPSLTVARQIQAEARPVPLAASIQGV